MKKFLASVCGGAALVAFLAGCDPHLAQIENGSEEARWYKQLKENYPSFTAPQTPAPAVYNTPNWNNSSRPEAAAAPADDPEKAVDNAAEGKNVKVVQEVEELPAPGKEQGKKADKADKGKEAAAAPEPAVEQSKAAPAPAPKQGEAEGKLYVVKAGDTLGGIAKQFYGKASLEDVIFRANSKVLKNRNALSIGMHLVIPEL